MADFTMNYPVSPIYKVGSKFGWREHPVHKNPDGTPIKLFHSGVDIGCPMGTPVRAGAKGVVVRVWYDKYNPETHGGGGGLSMRIKCDGGYMIGYCHLSEVFYGCNDVVEATDVVAFTGDNGVSTCPHLHCTVRKDGIPVDPEPFFIYPGV